MVVLEIDVEACYNFLHFKACNKVNGTMMVIENVPSYEAGEISY